MTWTINCNDGSAIVVHPADMDTSNSHFANDSSKWFFYNDETDVIDNALGSFVAGPGTPPAGTGSVRSASPGTQRRNLATYQFAGTPLADITTLKFTHLQPVGRQRRRCQPRPAT